MSHSLVIVVSVLALFSGCQRRDCAGNPPPGFNLHGTFVGIQVADYQHWAMRDGCGELRSFWVLNHKPSMYGVLENPAAFAGKRCSVVWRQTDFAVPEDGDRVHRVDEIVDVVWDD